MNRVGLFVPLGIFALILVVGFAGFQLADPHRLPSALIGKPFPEFSSTLLNPRGVGVDRSRLIGSPVLVNVWATWCPTCKAEHDELLRIRETTNLRIVGINYKDDPEQALRWLQEFGDPYEFNLLDLDGRLGVELGVYGAPESFLLDSEGTIVYKRVGEINERVWQRELAPRLRAMEVLGDA